MSIKIWEAYKVPVDKLNDFLIESRHIGNCKLKETLVHSLKGVLTDEFIKEQKEHYKDIEDEEKQKRAILWKAANDFFNLVSQSAYLKNGFESSLNVWLDGNYAYIIPYNISYNDILPDYAVDYHNQEQVGRPENISEDEYEARHLVWEKLCLNDWNATRLTYKIVDFDPFYYDSLKFIEDFATHNVHLFDV